MNGNTVADRKRGRENSVSQEVRRALESRGYTCFELLGEGAFSRVYRTVGQDGRMYACKISSNAGMLKQEAEILEKLCHPLFPAFFGFWRNAGLGFLMMEYVPGDSLEEMLRRRRGFSAEQICRTGMELSEGLCYLHERQEKYLFRDVKPSNIMIRQDGRIKLLDFGCVCSMKEKPAARAGTPGYASPGQLEGRRELTESCDIYGLGRTLETMLRQTGRGGRRRSNPASCRQRTGGRPIRKGLRRKLLDQKGRRKERRLKRILKACTRGEEWERISNMRDVKDLLGGLDRAEGGTWRQEALCRKNIWESMYKRS